LTNNTPDTVSELLNLNTPEPTPLEQVEKYCGELNYQQTLQVVRWLVNNMLNFHKERVEHFQSEGDTSSLTNWVIDSTHLWTCDQLLKKVD
jgi:hypothetical protein